MMTQVERAAKAQELADWFRAVAIEEADEAMADAALALDLVAGDDGTDDDDFDEDFDSYSSVDTHFEPPPMPAAANDNMALLHGRRRG